MKNHKKILYIIVNLAILGVVVFAAARYRDFFPEFPKETGQTGENETETAAFHLGREINRVKEEIATKFPEPDGAVSKIFRWQYKGKEYTISRDLYGSIYDFYKSQPKTYTYFNELPPNWEEEYYGMFISKSEKYDFAREFTEAIVFQGKKNKLTDDQMVELVLSFVQAIPYDDQKATNILARTGNETMNYPYETLFEGRGVCSDKSFLVLSLIRELGYGTAIFVYDNENHMAIGVQCPEEYSNYGSGYCYAETTSVGNKIGIIPELKASLGRAVGGEEIAYFSEGESPVQQTTKLGAVKIFQKTEGKEYRGIIKTVENNNEITSLRKQLDSLAEKLTEMKTEINNAEKDLADEKKKLDKYLKNGDIDKYNSLAKDYNEKLGEYEDVIKDYNKKVKEYNDKVARYNYLIKI